MVSRSKMDHDEKILKLLLFPEELIVLILEKVESPTDRLAMSMTCKTIARLNERYLYRDLRKDDDDESQAWEDNKGCSVRKVMRSLLRNSDRFTFVETLSLGVWVSPYRQPIRPSHSDRDLFFYDSLHSAESDTLKRAVIAIAACEWPESGGYCRSTWMAEDGIQDDVLVGILLSMLPNLKHLSVVFDEQCYFWFYGFMNAMENQPWPNTFSNLTSISLENWQMESGMSYGVEICLALPSLQKLTATRVSCLGTEDPMGWMAVQELNFSGSNVSHLTLHEVEFTTNEFDDILRWTGRSLTTLDIIFAGPILRDGGPLGRLPLESAPSALTELKVLIDRYFDDNIDESEVLLHPLTPLIYLKTLRCDYGCLPLTERWLTPEEMSGTHGPIPELGSLADVLPPNIENLELIVCAVLNSDIIAHLTSVFDAASTRRRLVHLKHFKLENLWIEWMSEDDRSLPESDKKVLGVGVKPKNASLIPRRVELKELVERATQVGVDLKITAKQIPRHRHDDDIWEDDDILGLNDPLAFRVLT